MPTFDQLAGEVGKGVASWRKFAADAGIDKDDIERMASAFEHDDLKKALS